MDTKYFTKELVQLELQQINGGTVKEFNDAYNLGKKVGKFFHDFWMEVKEYW